MKKFLVATVLLVAAVMTPASASVVDEIKKIDDIAAYHVPRFLIKNVLGMSDVFDDVIPNTKISALRDVESLDFIMVHKGGAKRKTRKLLDKLAKDNAYTVVMKAKKSKNHSTVVYGLPMAGAEDFKELIIVVDEDDNITIIDVKGRLNIDELSKITPEMEEHPIDM